MISEQTKEYYQLGKKNDVRESAKRLRRQFLQYKDAEIVYSIQHMPTKPGSSNAQTGDNAPLAIVGAILVLSALAVGAILSLKKFGLINN